MNELKPEDVMRALECCNTKGNCNQCPYEIVGEYTPCYSVLTQDALALLREKDAEIKGLVDGWSEDLDWFEQVCAEKNAEIERLRQGRFTVEEFIKGLPPEGVRVTFLDRRKIIAEAIDEFLAKARAREREMGDLKPFVTIEDLYETAKAMKGENDG